MIKRCTFRDCSIYTFGRPPSCSYLPSFNHHSCFSGRAMVLRDSLAQLEAKMDASYLTRMIRQSLFGDHLAAYAE